MPDVWSLNIVGSLKGLFGVSDYNAVISIQDKQNQERVVEQSTKADRICMSRPSREKAMFAPCYGVIVPPLD